jgi:hypothetical protein
MPISPDEWAFSCYLKVINNMRLKLLSGLLILIGLAACSQSPDNLKQLGTKPFSTDAWASANQVERGEMVYSFISGRKIEKMTANEVINELGEPTAYYEYDEFPAYRVGANTVESEYGKGYVLAFPIDRDSGLVRKWVLVPSV